MIASIYAILKGVAVAVAWIAKAAAATVTYLATHAAVGVAIGVGGIIAGRWLSEQPWAGADAVASLLGTLGVGVLLFSLGALAGGIAKGRTIRRVLKGVPKTIGATATWSPYTWLAFVV